MRKNYLKNPNVKPKTFSFSNFTDITDYAKGLFIGEQLTASNLRLTLLNITDIAVKYGYCVDDKIFIKSQNDIFYEMVDGNLYQKFNCGYTRGVIGAVILGGAKKIVYMDDMVKKVIDDDQVGVDLPRGTAFVTHRLRCFVANENTVYFSSPFDFENRSMMLDNCGNFSFSYEDGNVLGLFDFSTYLLIVCSKSFYKLTIVDGEFKLEKLNSDFYQIEQNSLLKMRDKVIFVSENKLYCYQDFEIKQLPSSFIKDVENFDNKATFNDYFYYCQTSDYDRKCVLAYDVKNNTENIVDVDDCDLMCKNILFTHRQKVFFTISNGYPNNTEWISTKIDLGSINSKSLIEVSVYVERKSTLKVKGDFGEKTFELKQGANKKIMNLRSKQFIFEILCFESGLSVRDLQLKYIA